MAVDSGRHERLVREVGERFGAFSPTCRDAAVDVAAAAAKGGGELTAAVDHFVHERAADQMREAEVFPGQRSGGESVGEGYWLAYHWLSAEPERMGVVRAGELGELLALGGAEAETQASLVCPELRWRDVLHAGRPDLPRFEFPDRKAVRDAEKGQALTDLVAGSVTDACDEYYERRSEAFAHWHDRARAVVPLDDKRERAAFGAVVQEKREEFDRSIEEGFRAIRGQAAAELAELEREVVEVEVEPRRVRVPEASRVAEEEAERRASVELGSDGRPARSLARRLAGSGERPDQVVCEYIAECFDAVMTRTVDSFDAWARSAFRRTSLDEPESRDRFWNEFDRRLEASRQTFSRDLQREKEAVFSEVKEALGPGYALPREAVETVAEAERSAGVREAVAESRERPSGPAVAEATSGGSEPRPVEEVPRERSARSAGGGGAEGGRRVVVPDVPDRRSGEPGSGFVDLREGAQVAAADRVREARAELVGTPQALAAGQWAKLDLMMGAVQGPRAFADAAVRLERSPLRQAGLESVGCDPLLVAAAQEARVEVHGHGEGADLYVLSDDLVGAHLNRCREDPAGADAAERRFASGRSVLRSSASAELVGEEPYGSRCRVEIDARLGRVPGRLPVGEVSGLSETGAKWLESMRETGAVPEAGREVRGGADARGWVGSLAGRRAQGFERVVQLAETRRCALLSGPAKALLDWGTAGGTWRAQAVGVVLASSKHLQAGLLRGNADPLAVAATSSLGSARRLAGGDEAPAGGDRRRLIQVACELSRHQRAAELSPEGHREARGARLDHWASHRGAGGSVAAVLKEAHGDRDQVLSRGWVAVEERRQEERLAGDRDFELLRERVDRGVQVWAQSWQGRGRQGFEEGPEFKFDGRAAYREGVVEESRVSAGVKALFELSGGSVRHAASEQSHVGVSEGLEVSIPEGLTGEKRQSALLYGAAQTVVLKRYPSMRAGDDEALVLSGVLASHMAKELDATYEPPSEAERIGPRQVSEGLLRRANGLVQEVAAHVEEELERRDGAGDRVKEIGDQVDFVARQAFGARVEEVVREEDARGRFEELERDAGAYGR